MVKKIWTIKEDEYLKQKYSDTCTYEIMSFLNRSYGSVVGRAYSLGLKKSKSYKRLLVSEKMLEAGMKTRFKKGELSWNAGLKGVMVSNSGSFKKGNKPHNWKPLGSERITVDGYVEVKYKDERNATSNYELKHRLIWISQYGSIPPGYLVVFKDGDVMNFDLSNLELISKKDNMLRNQISDTSIVKKFFRGADINDNKIRALVELKRAELILNRKIREYE